MLKGSQTGDNRGTAMGQAMDEARGRNAAQQQPGQAQPQQQQARAAGGQQFNWNEMPSFIPLPSAASQQSEVLGRIRSIMENEIKNSPDANYDISFIGIDKEEPGVQLGVSVLICAVQLRNARQMGVGYHTVLLEASTPSGFRPQQVPIGNGRSVDVPVTTGDTYDAIMIGEVRKRMEREFPNTKLFSADARVLGSDFNYNDDGLIKRLRAEIVLAASVTLAVNREGFKDFTLAGLSGPDNTLSLHTSFNNPQAMDAVGRPIRTDIRLDFRTGNPQAAQQSQSQNLEKVRDLTQVAGYIDFIRVAPPEQPRFVAPQQLQLQPGQVDPRKQQFIARFVITKLKSSGAPTLAQQILALATVYTLRQPAAWYPQFKPFGTRGKEVDLTDVGALNLEANLLDNPAGGQFMQTRTDAFSDQDLGVYLSTVVKPGLVVSADVEECGGDSWFNGIFAQAAAGDPDAVDTLYDATNYLTGGTFSQHMGRNELMVINEGNRIQNGYFDGEEGKQDIRYLDLLALYNLVGERDIAIPRKWMGTHINQNVPLPQRLDDRLNIQRELLKGFRLTGYSSRVTVTSKYLDALTTSIGQCGVTMREVSPFSGATNFDTPQYAFADAALGQWHQQAAFQRGGYVQPGQQYGGNQHLGRW